MTFMHPEFIYFMMPLIFILFYFLLTQEEQMHAFFSDEVADRLRVNSNRMTLQARNVLFLLMFIFIILALAFPVIEEAKIKVQAKSADIMVALDISDSMLAEDVYPTRLRLAKEKIVGLLASSPKERIGVMAFAKDAYMVTPLTFDHKASGFLVKQLKPSFITEKGTDVMQLLHAAKEMMNEQKQKTLLIISDGGEQALFSEEIAYAKAHGMTIFVLGVGTLKGVPLKEREGALVKQEGSIIVSRLNRAIADLATKSGGSYIEAVTTDKDMIAMMSEITKRSMKRTLQEEEITKFIPLFYFPLGMAMLLLLIATSSMSRREKLQMPGAFLVGWLLFPTLPAEAGLTDFLLLREAKEAYVAGDHERSAALYGKYARGTRSDEALYDQGNALYRSGKFEAATQVYEHVAFADKEQHFATLHNKGNAYARQTNAEAYRKAIATYEKALTLKEESSTRENLEQVRALLKEEQQRQSQMGEKKPEAKKTESPQQKGVKKEQPQGDKQSAGGKKQEQRSGEQSHKSKKEGGSGKKKQQEQSGMKEEGPVDEQQKKSAKEQNKNHEVMQSDMAEEDPKMMSDREEKKWLKILDRQPISHIYRIQTSEKRQEKRDAKPW